MSLKEELLQIKTYEEYEPQREKFRSLVRDKEVLEHLNMLYGKGYVGGDIEHGLIEEVYKTPPGKGGSMSIVGVGFLRIPLHS